MFSVQCSNGGIPLDGHNICGIVIFIVKLWDMYGYIEIEEKGINVDLRDPYHES